MTIELEKLLDDAERTFRRVRIEHPLSWSLGIVKGRGYRKSKLKVVCWADVWDGSGIFVRRVKT